MAYGDGINWNGAPQRQENIVFIVEWSPPSQIGFQITTSDTASDVATRVKDDWNTAYPGEAAIPVGKPTTVVFRRNGNSPTGMSVKVGSGDEMDLPEGPCSDSDCVAVAVVTGLTVRNV
ncbi:MAG: hypothetical protein ACYSUI_18140 [Planctomycetota bacterium]|jgi:hypothetical protein